MAAVSSRRTLGWSLVRRETASGVDGFFAGPPALAPPATAGLQQQEQPGPGPGPSAMAARITPAVLFITVVLAVVLLVSGLLHILRRLFLKSHRANARAEAVERQLQQLFHLHEDGPGLDQAAIDALPCFAYGELELSLGADAAKEGEEDSDKKKKKGTRPFDCAVCLCEFAADDRLRLLPLCGHAFHVACIDTWLRSSATCPLCRTQALSASAHALAAPPTADTDTPSAVLETGGTGVEEQQKQDDDASKEDAAFPGSVVLPVRLGRFKNVQGGGGGAAASSGSSSRRLDARRCYSMGSNYRYVLAEDNLVVSVRWRPGDSASGAAPGGGVATAAARRSEQQGKKVCAASRGDSFSVSKIWQWRGSGRRLPAVGRADGSESPPPDDGLPWAQAPARTRSARQEIDA